jgi:23S rRNA pseudouridine2605 synthase
MRMAEVGRKRTAGKLEIPKESGAQPKGRRVMLSRALSKLGFCSRTQAEVLIGSGRVRVGGRTVTDPAAWVDLSDAIIKVDGAVIAAEKQVYLVLNKPRGLVTTRQDPEGRPTVFDCLKDIDAPHLSPVGRLDKASEGLLLFTNDTIMAQALLDPASHVAKTYHVQVSPIMDDAQLARMTEGMETDGERMTASAARIIRTGEKNAWIEVRLEEGRNRQIRRMLDALGVECLRLVRVSIGGLLLGDLGKGATRELTAEEVAELRRDAGL